MSSRPFVHILPFGRVRYSILCLTLLFLVPLLSSAQTTIEYFFDIDPGFGKAQHATVTPDANGNCQLALPATGLDVGCHIMGLRTYHAVNEDVHYSPTLFQWIYVQPSGEAAFVSRAEYFFDNDPGFGKATPITFTPGKAPSLGDITHTASELSTGTHLLGIRAQAGDCWSPTILRNVVVTGKAISYVEYFWDTDPGYGNGTPIPVTAGATVEINNLDLTATSSEGTHYLGIRALAGDAWTPTIFYEYSSDDHTLNADDYAALQAFYNHFDGDNWTGHPWNISSNSIKSGKWGGVTFNADSRVMTINLEGKQLSGVMSEEHALNLPTLTGLNLSKNQLTGDPAAFLKHTTQLTSLDLSYNQLDELSASLPVNAVVNLGYQHRKAHADTTYPGLELINGPELQIGTYMTALALPVIWGYSHERQLLTTHPELRVCTTQNAQIGTMTWEESIGGYRFSPYGSKTLQANDGTAVILQPTYKSDLQYSAWPATMRFTLGDANIDGVIDVTDVQRTLVYILGTETYQTGPIALWPANTYTTGETTRIINIQDIVCIVNLVLENEAPVQARRRAATTQELRNSVYADGRNIMIDAQDEIGAIDIELDGVKPTQVKLMLSSRNWQMQTRQTASGGTRLVVFSPNGSCLPKGITNLLQLSADGQPAAVTASSQDAVKLEIGVLGLSPTGINMMTQPAALDAAIVGRQLMLSSTVPCGPTTVSVYGTQGMLLWQQQMDSLPSGETALPLPTTEKLLLVKVWSAETGMRIFKLHNEK